MVIDFGFLKQIMMDTIHRDCDHGMILFKDDILLNSIHADRDGSYGEKLYPNWLKLKLIDCVPTAENLAKLWFDEVNEGINAWHTERDLDIQCTLDAMHVWETPNCLATYKPNNEFQWQGGPR